MGWDGIERRKRQRGQHEEVRQIADISYLMNSRIGFGCNDPALGTVTISSRQVVIDGTGGMKNNGYLAQQSSATFKSTVEYSAFTVNTSTHITSGNYYVDVDYSATGVSTITLSTADLVAGRTIEITDSGMNAGINSITIDTQGSELINGLDYIRIFSSGGSYTISANKEGTKWIARPKDNSIKSVFVSSGTKTIVNTTTESSLFNGGRGTLKIPAGSLRSGYTYKIKGKGIISTGVSQNATFAVKIGTYTLVSNTATLPTNLTDSYWQVDFDINCISSGVSGSMVGIGCTFLQTAVGISTVSMRSLTSTTPITVDTTLPLTIDLTYTWENASASNSATIQVMTVEQLQN